MVLGADVLVHRNDQITVDEARALAPTHLCISPGPGTPHDAGVSMQMIEAFAGARAGVRRLSRVTSRSSKCSAARSCAPAG